MNLFVVLSKDERTITFISDRYKGLLQSVANDLPKENYSDAIFLSVSTVRCGVEPFNSWIRKERLLPIFQLVRYRIIDSTLVPF
ncbi:hypothetical protein DVH24_014134 [Malus domestica]|uniref:Uncharacterized protein n=1 Tax=Malus domestica TaxID=3750 RepID=A0A498JD05_MALDO|nr:hypothetical protein DVH24_014134 [Malus domestica]